MISRVTITPKLDVVQWSRKNLQRDWFEFQAKVYNLASITHNYIRNYISTHAKRKPITGNLVNAIDLKIFSGPASIGFGIGNMEILQSKAPYWYVVNFGKKVTGEQFSPGGGQWRPVRFGNSPADPQLRGKGRQKATVFAPIGNGQIPSFIRPMNYIQATVFQFNRALRAIMPKSAMPGQLQGTRGTGGGRAGGVWRT